MNKKIVILFGLYLLLFSSALVFNVYSLNIKLYMIVVVFIFVFYIDKVFDNIYFYSYEKLFFLLYLFIAFTSIYADDIFLAYKLILGESIILITYITTRYLLANISISDFENFFYKLSIFFIIISFLLYFYGLILIYYTDFNISSTMYLNEHSSRIFGVYLEGNSFPRLTGVAESPNNFMYIAFLLSNYFYYKKYYYMVGLTFISIVLTMSATGLILLGIFLSYFIIVKKQRIVLFFIIFSIVLVYILYINNEFIKNMIDLRIARIISGSGRYDLWYFILEKINDNILFGYGANQSRIVLENYVRNYQSAHNSFFDILLTTGFFGFFLYCLIYVVLLKISIKLNKFYDTIIFLMLFVEYVIISMANNTLHIDYTIIYYLFIYIYYTHYKENYEKVHRKI